MFFTHSFTAMIYTPLVVTTSVASVLYYRQKLKIFESTFTMYFMTTLVSTSGCLMMQQFYFGPKVLQGNYSCQLCCTLSGSLLQGATGFALPNLVGALTGAAIAQRYQLSTLPEQKLSSIRKFWLPKMFNFSRSLSGLVLLNLFFGGIIAYNQYKVSDEVQRTITKEEQQEIIKQLMGVGYGINSSGFDGNI